MPAQGNIPVMTHLQEYPPAAAQMGKQILERYPMTQVIGWNENILQANSASQQLGKRPSPGNHHAGTIQHEMHGHQRRQIANVDHRVLQGRTCIGESSKRRRPE